ncbi:MAG: cysteine hydrolase family protein [Pseudomonadota bacterium]
MALADAVLLVIDVQRAIDAPYQENYGPRNNPDAERTIAGLLALWRQRGAPIVHVRHDSTETASAYRPGQPGNAFKDEVAPRAGEIVVVKRTNNAFIDTNLPAKLSALGRDALVICGVATNNSVEATARMAGNLGYDTYVVSDACFCFAKPDYNGVLRSAEDVHAMSLANLDVEYCAVLSAAAVRAALARQ